jgi:hypothetical protein
MAGAVSLEGTRVGRAILVGAMAIFVGVSLPVVVRGAPLADDLNNCLAPQEIGLGGFLSSSWDRLGMVRPARFVEIVLTTGICRSLPFGVAIAVSMTLTIAVGLLLRGLLRDLEVRPPWPDVGAAVWFLQPLGTEAGLWPAALHVPLGLGFALVAARCHRRGRHVWAALATAGAVLSVEQTIFVLPFVAFLVAPASQRRRAAATSAAVSGAALVAFVLWPGTDPRLRAGVGDRLIGMFRDPGFYVGYPAVGLGLHSIPLAARWAFPWSIAVLGAGAAIGSLIAARLPQRRQDPDGGLAKPLAAFVVAIVLVNIPVVLADPRQGSPRIFTPTWLLLAFAAGWFGARLRGRAARTVWTLAGVYAGGAVLSLALSVSVRGASADVVESATRTIAARVPDGGEVAICGIRRTVTSPAPRGAFAVHEFVYDWAADDALAYYTGQRATFHLSGELWGRACPSPGSVDGVFRFDELVAEARE